jgi:hypothetical protein
MRHRIGHVPGPAIAALSIADPPERWAALGFAVSSDGTCRVGATILQLGAGGEGIVGWTLTGSGSSDFDGLPTAYGDPPSGPPPSHPNTTIALDHVVLASHDVERTFAALGEAGMVLRRERAIDSPERPMRQGFFRHGEAILEVVGPQQPDGAGPSRLWGITVNVTDLETCAVLLGERLGTAREAVQPGRRIATLRQEAGLSVPLAFMTA